MLRIKTSKTNLCRLVREKTEPIPWIYFPAPKESRFWKAYRRPDYFLEWYWDRYFYRAFLAVVGGSPLLTIERSVEGGEDRRQVFWLTVEELQERGMVEYVPEKQRAAFMQTGGT